MTISYREPLRTTIELKTLWKWDFHGRFFDDSELLCFIVRLFCLEYSYTDDAPRDTSTRDDDLASIGCGRESLASEDEFFDGDIFEDFVFWHDYCGDMIGSISPRTTGSVPTAMSKSTSQRANISLI